MSASAIMGVVLYLIPHPTKLTLTLTTAATGRILYIVLLLAIDKKARILIKSILQETSGRFTWELRVVVP